MFLTILEKFKQLFKKDGRKIKKISYFGFAGADEADPLYKEAYECAKFLAEKGYVTVNGGGPGTMKATTKGAQAVHGKTIGVTFYPKDMANFEGRDKTNIVDEEIKMENYLKRTLKLLEMGDVYVFFKGGTGTISEFGMAWGLARLYFGSHKPLVLYGDFWNNIIRSFNENMRIRPEDSQVYKVVNSPQEAYEAILSFENSIKGKEHMSPEEKAFQL